MTTKGDLASEWNRISKPILCFFFFFFFFPFHISSPVSPSFILSFLTPPLFDFFIPIVFFIPSYLPLPSSFPSSLLSFLPPFFFLHSFLPSFIPSFFLPSSFLCSSVQSVSQSVGQRLLSPHLPFLSGVWRLRMCHRYHDGILRPPLIPAGKHLDVQSNECPTASLTVTAPR